MEDQIFFAECGKNIMIFKTLIELVSLISFIENVTGGKKIIKQLCFKIHEDGLEIYSDSCKIMTSHISLNKNYFKSFNFFSSDPLCIGISLSILKTSFKYVSRNDILQISITKDEYSNFPNKIVFILNEFKGFSIKFNIVQNVLNEEEDNLSLLTNISSARLLNLYREVGGIKKQVKFIINDNKIRLSSTLIDIAENWVDFPLLSHVEFKEIILKSEYFKILSKIGNLESNVNIYLDKTDNLIFKTNILRNKSEIIGNVFIKIITR